MPNEHRGPGVNYFLCDECQHEWLDFTRDISSPSGDDCPSCHCRAQPMTATTEQFDRLYWARPEVGRRIYQLLREVEATADDRG